MNDSIPEHGKGERQQSLEGRWQPPLSMGEHPESWRERDGGGSACLGGCCITSKASISDSGMGLCACVCVCVCVCARARHALSHVPLFVTPRTVARQAPLSMEFSRQECCSGLPFPTPGRNGWRSEKSQRAMPFGQLLTYQVKIFKPNHQTEYNAHPPIHNLLSGLFH